MKGVLNWSGLIEWEKKEEELKKKEIRIPINMVEKQYMGKQEIRKT